MTNREPDAHFALDPFGPAANPKAYVPRDATERVLREIEASLAVGRIPALVGPPGLGKSLLLHRVGSEQELLRSLYIPFCALPIDELSSFALRLFGASAGGDPVEALLAQARALGREGTGILLLIDDAGAMPVEAARELGDLAARSDGALRIALAAVEGDASRHVCAAFGSAVETIRLDETLDEEEARHYVATRLAFAEADGRLCAAFDAETVAHLHRASEGNPRRLNLAAQTVLRDMLGEPQPAPAGDARDAAPRGAATRSGIAALLEQEPDVRAVVESLRSGNAAPRTDAPSDAPRDVGSTAAAGRQPEPGATIGAEARRDPGSTLPSSQPDRRESRVGTYRMLKSAEANEIRREAIRPDRGASDRRERGAARAAGGDAQPSPKHAEGPLAARSAPSQSGGSARPALQRGRRDRRARLGHPPRPYALEAIRSALRGALVAIGGTAIIGAGAGIVWLAQRQIATSRAEHASSANAADQALPGTRTAAPAPAEREPPPTGIAPPVAKKAMPEPSSPKPRPEARRAPSAASPVAPPTEPTPLLEKPVIVRVGINATPWAVIEVDGVEIGETPLAGVGIPQGRHVFRARMPDGSVREREIEIDPQHRHVVFE